MAYDPNLDEAGRKKIEEEIDQMYRSSPLGRAPDEGERRSELENYQKNGAESIRRNLGERSTNTPGEDEARPVQQSSGGSSRDSALQSVSQAYNSATSNPASNGTAELLGYLKEQDATRQAQQADVRKILMEQLGAASRPVDVNDPALKAQLDPQRLALQRSAERKRSMLAARLANDNLLDSGTMDT